MNCYLKVFIFCAVFILACGKDEYNTSYYQAPYGKIGMEERFFMEDFIGHIAYLYDQKERIIEKCYYNTDEQLKAIERYTYQENRLYSIVKRNASDSSLISAEYRNFYDGKLVEKLLLKDGYEKIDYFYEDGLLKQELHTLDKAEDYWLFYDYSSNSNEVIRIWRKDINENVLGFKEKHTLGENEHRWLDYDSSGDLVGWLHHRTYGDSLHLETYYLVGGVQGEVNETRFVNGLISSEKKINVNGQETEKSKFLYDLNAEEF